MNAGPETAKIVPRWEWRIFAKSLAALAARVPEVAGVAARQSEEIYLLNLRGAHNAKIRGGAFDIKQLREVNAAGLELWSPAFKGEFPLSRGQLQQAFAAWALPAPDFARDIYSLDQFLGEVALPALGLRVARVAKARRGFVYGGCTAEFAGVEVDGVACETFCLEHENPALILAALGQLGLVSQANVNYPEGLKRALGIGRAALAAA